jgi:Xaa-Pro aminopeptidase
MKRVIKTPREISKIKKACNLGDKVFDYILRKIHLGITEKELVREIDSFIKNSGSKPSFPTIVAFGKNSANIHNVPADNKLAKNQIILLDFGVELNGYCSDMTRTIFFGKPTEKQKKMYGTVLKAQSLAIKAIKDKSILKKPIKEFDIDKIARDYIISQGFESFKHGLGHGIGKKVHEFPPRLSPKSKNYLKVGMVFSIEPGIYISNFGGVRIEDLVVLEKSGPRILTRSPKNFIIL